MKIDRDASQKSSRSRAHPRQLSDADAVFISLESSKTPSHIAGLTIVDPTNCPEFDFDRFLEILHERIDLVARFKWKLFEPPMGIDRAYWVEDQEFDVANHVHRVAVPRPGDRMALAELAGLLHAQPLDRSNPLWECWWIEGLEDDRVAMLLKFHHCLMDGQSGIGLSEILMDLTPEPARNLSPPEEAIEPPPRRPALWEMGRAALTNGLQIPAAIATHSQRALVQGFRRARHDPADALPPHVPHVAFNGKLTPDRSFAFASVPLGPLRDAKKHFDVTMNDVLLEIVASSLRHGLREHGELPEEPVVGLCPVSIRRDGDHTFGNQISSMPVSLATDLDDVPARLAAIHESSDAAKRRLEAGAFETLTALGECLVPGILKALTRVALAYPSIVPLPANLVISNVRGLSVPMYLAGARVEEIYPMSMLQIGNGMNVTAFSHDDQVDFGFLVESKLVRDPWLYADGVREALVELEAAVAARSKTLETDAAPALPHSSDPPDPSDAPPVLAQEDSADSSSACSYSSSSSRSMGQSTNGQAVPGQASSPSEAVIFEDEPLNLQLMITQFRHLRAPARDAILRDEKESSPGGDRA